MSDARLHVSASGNGQGSKMGKSPTRLFLSLSCIITLGGSGRLAIPVIDTRALGWASGNECFRADVLPPGVAAPPRSFVSRCLGRDILLGDVNHEKQ